jgi:putative tryptophan/tyrosine transport system substrate-binding protein
MRRREVIALIASATLARPASPQTAERVRRVGIILGLAEGDPEAPGRLAAFRHGLQALGWVEGRNLELASRSAGADATREQALARELVQSGVEVVLATSGPTVVALQRETRRLPIVFVMVVDPPGRGFVDSLARPGRNLTGLTHFEPAMGGKWLELLKEMAPGTARVGFLYNPDTAGRGAGSAVYVQSFEKFAATLGVRPVMMPVRDAAELGQALDAFGGPPSGAVLVPPDSFNTNHRTAIVQGTIRHRLPAIFPYRYYTADGGLMSYGVDVLDLYRRAASYVDRILKGESPAEMPVEQPTKFELVINVKTARALGLTIPPTLLARADEVIE